MAFDLKGFLNGLNKKNLKEDTISNKNKSKKLYFTGHEQLQISAESDKKAEEITNIAYNVLQKYMDNPKAILHFIEEKGTKIVYAPALLPIMKFLGYEEGFIPKHEGIKAAILNFAMKKVLKEKKVFSLSMPDVFIVCKKDLSLYFIAYQFHHWLSYMNNLPGYDTKSMNLFRSTFGNEKANLSLLSINQILALKDTVERDTQAVEFVQKFVREQVGAKERLNSMLNGEAVKI